MYGGNDGSYDNQFDYGENDGSFSDLGRIGGKRVRAVIGELGKKQYLNGGVTVEGWMRW